MDWRGYELLVSRCGYTGEDGFEISLPPEIAEEFAVALLDDDEVALIGLGARDSLRLEAGLCLYGHDIDLTTSPAEADLLWTIPKRRRNRLTIPVPILFQRISHRVRRGFVSVCYLTGAPRRARAPIFVRRTEPHWHGDERRVQPDIGAACGDGICGC
ncbi:MAG: hypothetical protein CM15mP55_0420 [Hyphomicrobiales bacterium]|nr:MAG: hypothetical protein CM15mP55_0420 [Hyphomicrobiales bacterium]